MEDIFKIRFKKTKSKLYHNSVNIMIGLPNYTFVDDYHCVRISKITDFIRHRRSIDYVLNIVIRWKTCEVVLYGQKLTHPYYTNILESKVGKYWEIFSPYGNVDYEDLPLPYVHFPESGLGSFIGFSNDIDTEIYFCECQRKSIENYIQLRELPSHIQYVGSRSNPLGSESFPLIVSEQSREWTTPIINHLKFRKGLCFRCNNLVPKRNFSECGTEFTKKYGWYIMEEYFNLGIDILREVILPKYSNLDITGLMKDYFDTSRQLHKKIKQILLNPNIPEEDKKEQIKNLNHCRCPDHRRLVENKVREDMGFRKIGDGWVSETMLYNIIAKIFPKDNIIRHFRPQWLDKLELDIYLPERKLGFEYQGIQHYKPIEYWGGEYGFKVVQEHDKRKKELCVENNVTLICVDYDEPLEETHIRNRIKEVYNEI